MTSASRRLGIELAIAPRHVVFASTEALPSTHHTLKSAVDQAYEIDQVHCDRT